MKNKLKAYICISLTIVVLLFTMAGCDEPDSKVPYNNKMNVSDVQAQEITDEIERLAYPNHVSMSLSFVKYIDDLKESGIVNIVRFNKGRYYSVTPCADNKYLFLLYNESSEQIYVIDGFLVSVLADKDDFKDIFVGQDRDEILKKDPSSFVLEDYSYHRFSDKSVLCVKYELNDENRYVVSEYEYIEMSDSVLDYLLKQDLQKILKS